MKDFWLVIEYSLEMSGTNVAIERILYITQLLWIDEEKVLFSSCNQSNNNLKICSCIDLYDVTQLKLLNAISLQKY